MGVKDSRFIAVWASAEKTAPGKTEGFSDEDFSQARAYDFVHVKRRLI